MIIETIWAYLAIIAPSAITVITAIAALITAIYKFISVVKQNKGLKEEIAEMLKTQSLQMAAVLRDNEQLKQALIENTEALTRIRNKHPELFTNTEKEE